MKLVIKSIAAAVALSAAGAMAAVLPRVGSGTEPNQWTRNIEGVLSAAQKTNLPILLVMINDSSSGEGCQHCMQFVTRTLNTENFANVVANYEFYMVLLNDYRSPLEPDYGGVSADLFNKYFYQYEYGDSGYPQVVVLRPDGTRYKVWSYKSRPVGTSGTIMYQYIAEALSDLAPEAPNNTVFSLSAQSGNTVTVQADNPAVWTGVVTRSGGTAATGEVALSLEGAAKSLYTLSAASLAWDSSDGSKTFTVTGPSTIDERLVNDTITVKISASGFSGTDISYGTSSLSVTFKDARIEETLPVFENPPKAATAYKLIGAALNLSATASSSVTYSAKGLPAGMKINAKTGVITGAAKAIKDYAVTVTATAENGSTSTSFTLSVAKFPKEYTKPKYALFFFDDADAIIASAQLKVASSGKWTAKIAEGGRQTTIKGVVASREDGALTTNSSGLNLVYDPQSGIWSGSMFGRRVYGRAMQKADATWKGKWNFGIASSSSAGLRGWATAKVGASGTLSVTGLVPYNAKISGGGASAVFPAAFVASNLPRWAGHGDVRFGHASTKAGVNVGCALFSDGTLGGNVSLGSQIFDVIEGSLWTKTMVAGLNGAAVETVGGGDIKIPVVASDSKLAAGPNEYRASVKCTASSGKVTVSYKLNGATHKANGVIYGVGGTPKASGGGAQRGEWLAFTID